MERIRRSMRLVGRYGKGRLARIFPVR